MDQVHFIRESDSSPPIPQSVRISPNPVNVSSGTQTVTFTIDPTLTITPAGNWLELRNGGGGAPFRLTGQTQADLAGA